MSSKTTFGDLENKFNNGKSIDELSNEYSLTRTQREVLQNLLGLRPAGSFTRTKNRRKNQSKVKK